MKYFGYFKYFKKVWFWIALSWHILLVFTLPPLMDIFGRCKHYISFLNNGPIKLIMVIIMAKNMIKIMITMIKIWTGACWHCMYNRLLAWQFQAIQNILSTLIIDVFDVLGSNYVLGRFTGGKCQLIHHFRS